MTKLFFTTLTCVWFSIPCVLAQFPQPAADKWEVSFFGGAAFTQDKDLLTPVQGQETPRLVNLDYSSGYQLGLRISENLGPRFGAELEYSFANQPLNMVNVRPSVASLSLDHKIHNVHYSLVVYAGDRNQKIRPYGVIGAGASYFQLDGGSEGQALLQGIDIKDRWKFAFAIGGGFKYWFSRWGLRFDVRDQITGVPDYGLPAVAPDLGGGSLGAALRPEGELHNWQLNVGLIYRWGQ